MQGGQDLYPPSLGRPSPFLWGVLEGARVLGYNAGGLWAGFQVDGRRLKGWAVL
jgi:hypothetical protein